MSFQPPPSRSLESETSGETVNTKAIPDPRPTRRTTLKAPHLRTAQKIHACLLLMVPFAGVVALIPFSYFFGIRTTDIVLLVTFYVLSLCGITIGYHRHFSHRSFKATRSVRLLAGILGGMAAQGPLTYWVANHRRHHADSDGVNDPHSPTCRGGEPLAGWRGFLHAHIGWTMTHEVTNSTLFARDLLRDPVVRFLNRYYLVWVLLGLILPAGIGALVAQSWVGAVAGFLWGGLARIFFAFHATSLINSAGHMFGHRSFDTPDTSRNLSILALLTLGESWHNNHHAFPSSAIFGVRPREGDLGGLIIRGMGRFGLASSIRCPSPALVAKRQALEKG